MNVQRRRLRSRNEASSAGRLSFAKGFNAACDGLAVAEFGYLVQNLRHSERTGVPVALMVVDLDHFKEVNDLLGHDAGNILLRQSAQRISACVRRTDTVARLGGDEFTVLLTEVKDIQHVEVLAQKIVDELDRPFHLLQDVAHTSPAFARAVSPAGA